MRRFAFFLSLAVSNSIQAAMWRPLDQAQLAMKSPVVEKDADAEILLWDIRVEDKITGQDAQVTLLHYVRMKVFTDKGAKDLSSLDIPLFRKRNVVDLAARTIQPDGKITEMQKDAVFQKELLRSGRNLRIKSKSFAVPNVTPGAIIEYQYREVRDDELSNYIQLRFSREYPIHSVTYHIKPLQIPLLPFSMRGYRHMLPEKPFEQERDGYSAMTMTNVPAFKEEPDMPPEDTVQPWLMVYYSDKDKKPEQYWKEQGKEQQRLLKEAAKINGDIKKTAAEVVSGLSSDDEKLAKLAAWCRNEVKNVNTQGSGLTPAQRDAFKPNRAPADTLKQGMGTGWDINMLFAAMAMSLNYDVRAILICDRSQHFFNINFPDLHFLGARSLAVKTGADWKFYDPASTYLPPGMLRWQEEGAAALLSDPKEGSVITTPLSDANISVRRRKGELVLDAEGTLEGKLTLTYTGHASVDQKNAYDQDSAEKREERIRDIYKNYFPTAEITAIQIDDNINDASKPFSYSCSIKIPGYAQRTGKRLLFQPAVFQAGRQARFRETNRRYDIYFDYPWSEEDDVNIAIPDGFELDNASAPPSTSFGKVGEYAVSLALNKNGLDRKLIYKRKLIFGREGTIMFPKNSYAAVKKAFDFVHEQDNHMLSLKVAQ